ncbi:MAG: copper amine oxidase N-terminal domain-containing protein [Caldisericia bacterium]
MKKTFAMLLVLVMFVCVSVQDSFSSDFLIIKSSDWVTERASNYPEVKKNKNPELINKWRPDQFEGKGKLYKKWGTEIDFEGETIYNFIVRPEGWIYSTSKGEAEGMFEYETDEGFINNLINPETGESEVLPPEFSMFSTSSVDKVVCEPIYNYKDPDAAIDIRCYDIENDEILWEIHDDRTPRAYVGPHIPIFRVGERYFYFHSGITEFDIKTGEILWSEVLKKPGNDGIYQEYLLGIFNLYFLDHYVFLSTYDAKYRYYRIDLEDKSIDELINDIDYTQRFIADEEYLWICPQSDNYIYKYDPVTFRKLDSINIKKMILDKIDSETDKNKRDFAFHPPKGDYTPITVYLGDKEKILRGRNNMDNFIVSDVYCGGYQMILPNFEYETYHFLLNRKNTDELIEILPEMISGEKTYIQFYRDQLLVYTKDTITSCDFETSEELWTINKTEFENPDKARIQIIESRGILVRDYSEEKKAIYYCYDIESKAPKPEPVPEPEPEPIPEPTPEPEPIPEPEPEPTPEPEAIPEPDPTPSPIPEPIIGRIIKLEFQINRKSYILDGVERLIDAAPIIRENRTYLPARHVAEPLGGDVGWEGEEKKVICVLGDVTVEFWIGKPIAKINGQEVQIDLDNPDVVPMIIDDRTMVPMRFLAETFGCEVEWVADTKEIILTYSDL